MNRSRFGACLGTLALLGLTSAVAQTDIPLDKPTTVDGVEVVCTGIGDSAHDPRWAAYPLKIVFAGKGGQFVTDVDVTISHDGKALMTAHCGGAWMLAKLAPGRYELGGVLDNENASTKAVVSAKGQGRAILRFPGEGGTISPQHKPTD